jgi:hypothetical protein
VCHGGTELNYAPPRVSLDHRVRLLHNPPSLPFPHIVGDAPDDSQRIGMATMTTTEPQTAAGDPKDHEQLDQSQSFV